MVLLLLTDNTVNEISVLLQSPVAFTCMPMFVSIDCHSEKCVISHVLSSNMPIFVSVCIAENPFSRLQISPRQFKNSQFLQVIGCVCEY